MEKEEKLKVKILVCCHKPDKWLSDDVHMPIHCGKAISDVELGIQGDDTGDNISTKNSSYCELTAMYWAWKNLKDVDYIGLCHYRRYFAYNYLNLFSIDCKTISSGSLLNKGFFLFDKDIINKYDIILAKKSYYYYDLMTNYSRHHISEDMNSLRSVILDICPDYLESFDKIIFCNNKLSHYNMFITSWEFFDEYCKWLFDVLFELERRINIDSYNKVQKRIFAYLAERLMNVYVDKKKMKVKYYPVCWINDEIHINVIIRFFNRMRNLFVFNLLNILK